MGNVQALSNPLESMSERRAENTAVSSSSVNMRNACPPPKTSTFRETAYASFRPPVAVKYVSVKSIGVPATVKSSKSSVEAPTPRLASRCQGEVSEACQAGSAEVGGRAAAPDEKPLG